MKEIVSEISIVGGGLTGLLTAFALSKESIPTTIIDKNKFINEKSGNVDFRTAAISEGSKEFFESIGLWKKIAHHAEPIYKIIVYDRNVSSNINFQNPKKNNFLGYVIKNSILKKYLINFLKTKKDINLIEGELVEDLVNTNDNIIIKLKNHKILSKLLVAADGKNSFVRSFYKTNFFMKSYNHAALVVNFNHTKNHKNIAYEIFKKTGPLAILPMKSSSKKHFSSSLIWSHKKDFAESMSKINNNLLKEILEENISYYVGQIVNIFDAKSFKLSAHINTKFYDNRIVYLGDSAHSLHPIAGQGWNLGIRDIKRFLDITKNTKNLGLEVGEGLMCKKYHDSAFYDSYLLYQITDKLNSIFLDEKRTAKLIRSTGFNLIDKNLKIKKFITNYAMGF